MIMTGRANFTIIIIRGVSKCLDIHVFFFFLINTRVMARHHPFFFFFFFYN